jgi:outer membrane protein assembly factor BamB
MFLVGNTIYSPGTDGYVYALDARTGKLAWKRPFDATIALATSNVIYLHTNINMHMTDLYPDLVAIRAKDGAILWHLSIPGLYFTAGSILNVDGILYDLAVATDSHGRIIPNTGIYAVRSSDGKLLWHLPVTGAALVA